MSNIIENEWMRLTSIQIIQCIRCLSECIRLMFEPDLRKFIPKVCICICISCIFYAYVYLTMYLYDKYPTCIYALYILHIHIILSHTYTLNTIL